ncbi:MAG: archaellum operon transcriptional activator EarA family protein [Methanobacteriota archaeon]
MYEEKGIAESINLKRPLVVRALRRSDIRKKIAKHLFDISPSGSYVSDIAYHVNTTPTNVIGAIRGLNKRYRKEESLLSLDIVEEIISGRNLKVYKLTEFGKEIISTMNERR